MEPKVSPTLQLTFFGTLEIHIDGNNAGGFRSQKAQALLCYLATTGRAHNRSALSGLLWGDSPEEQARASLRQALSNIGELCQGRLTITRHSIAFNRQHPYTLDTETFERAATRLIAQPGLTELHPALDLYQGDFLEGFILRNAPDFETWSLGVRAHYHQLALQAFNAVAHDCATAGDPTRAIAYHRRLLQIEPWHEPSHRQLMALLVQTDQRNAALDQYRLLTRVLADELGVEPDTATKALYEEIRKNGSVDAPPAIGATPLPLPPASPAQPPSPSQEPFAPPPLVTSPFVGREGEIAALMRALETVRRGEGQLRFVTGSAGQGKSTLVQEFLRRAQASHPHLIALTGHCNAYTGSGDPYLPFRQMLSLLTGEAEGQSAQGSVARENARRLWHALPDTLAALVENSPDLIGSLISAPALLERATAFAAATSPTHYPWLQTLLTLCVTPQANALDERRIFTQFGALFNALSNPRGQARPLLILLEDLHWADVPSCGLLFHLSRTLQMTNGGTNSIFIIATYRPTEIPTGVPTGTHPLAPLLGEFKRQHGAIWLDLDARDAAGSRAFVEAYIDTEPNLLDDSFRAALFQRTGGHALFTVELMRELQAHGDLYQEGDGRWRARPQIDWQALPAKVEGVIEGQLGTLEGRAQAILRAAAVQGESFTAEVIAQLLHEPEQAVVSTLGQELGQKQRLVSSQEQLWIGNRRLSRYAFRHFLFQDYLYHSLDQAERIYLHEAVGNTLEQLYGEESAQIATQLAYHFRQAGLIDKVVATLLLAGQRAQQMAAHKEAIYELSQGLELLETLPPTPTRQHQLLDYLIALATAMDTAGNYDYANIERIYQRARALCHQLGEKRKLWSVLHGLYFANYLRGRHYQGYAIGEELLQIGHEDRESEPTLIALMLLEASAMATGDFIGSIAFGERAIALYDPVAHRDLDRLYINNIRVFLVTTLAASRWLAGYADQAEQLCEKGMQVAIEANQPYGIGQAHLQMAWLLEYRREWDECATYSATLSHFAAEHEYHFMLCSANLYAGMVMVEQGQAEAGLARLSEAIANLRASGNMMAQCHFTDLQARGYAAVGKLQEAIELIDAALASTIESGEHHFDAELLRLKGEFLQRQGAPLAGVEALFEEAIAVAQQQAAKMWELRATISLCILWQQQGKGQAAHDRLAALYAWFTEGFDTPDLQAARALLDALA